MSAAAIREQVLRAIARNRAPGLHFAGNFVDLHSDLVDDSHAHVTADPGAHAVCRDGAASLGVVAMVADIALAGSIRAGMDPRTRLATVSMTLQLTGLPARGPLEGHGEFRGFLAGGTAGQQGLARATVQCAGGVVCHGQGAFMALEPPPGLELHAMPSGRRDVALLPERSLTREERALLRHADAVLEEGTDRFADRLWGYVPHRTKSGASCTMRNGPHVANRVHHVQGGLLVGLAAATASGALNEHWALSAITACFVSPGQGARLRAQAKVAHHGMLTAVVHTVVKGAGGRKVLESVSTHARIGSRP